MEKRLCSVIAVLTLASAAPAQFTLKGYTGKVIQNVRRPDVRFRHEGGAGSSSSIDTYFLWRRDHVRVQSVEIGADQSPQVVQGLFYYADFSPKTTRVVASETMAAMGSEGFECALVSKSGATIPTYTLSRDLYSEAMADRFSIIFPTRAQGLSFLKTLTEKQQTTSRTKPARITLKAIKRERP